MRPPIRSVLALAAAVTASCRGGSEPPLAVPDVDAWRAALVADRAQNDAEMRTSPLSPLAAVERHILPPAAATYVDVTDDAVQLRADAGPGERAALVFHPGADARPWSWEPRRDDVRATGRDGKTAVAPGPVAAPTRIALGRFTLLAQPVEGTFVVSVYDAAAEALRHFTGVLYFAPDARYAVTATLERSADPKQITMPTSIGLEKTFVRYGTLRFEIGGERHQLTAFQPVGASGALFVPFRDATSGKATYGAGRYLDLEAPRDGASLLLDFNRAYSPLCSYSPAFNCPLPPRENHLTAAIEAGEKTYPH